MTESPVQQAIVMGPPLFVTLSNIYDADTTTTFTITFDTDQPVICNVTAWAGSSPNVGTPLTPVVDASARTHHVITVTPPAGNAGNVFAFQIALDSTDTSGFTLRPYIGVTQLARRATPDVPARFYMYGDGSRPAGGGANKMNWSSYTWAQYNSKGTTYPTP